MALVVCKLDRNHQFGRTKWKWSSKVPKICHKLRTHGLDSIRVTCISLLSLEIIIRLANIHLVHKWNDNKNEQFDVDLNVLINRSCCSDSVQIVRPFSMLITTDKWSVMNKSIWQRDPSLLFQIHTIVCLSVRISTMVQTNPLINWISDPFEDILIWLWASKWWYVCIGPYRTPYQCLNEVDKLKQIGLKCFAKKFSVNFSNWNISSPYNQVQRFISVQQRKHGRCIHGVAMIHPFSSEFDG